MTDLTTQPFWVYEDDHRGLALIRGRAIVELLDADHRRRAAARWSTAGKGWVLPLTMLPDLLAEADLRNLRYRLKDVVA